MTTIPKFRYLSAWFCPYAHRATLALEHHSERISYEWVEALGWEQRKDENNITGTGKEWWYHWKSEELTRSNPSALVPTVIPIDATTGVADESKAVYESQVVVDYIDQVSNATGEDRLTPVDPYDYAKSRIWCDKVNRECCSPYYGVLVRKDPAEQHENFLPNAQLSNVDIMLIPWAYRFYIFEHYRGYTISKDDAELEHYHAWYDYVMNLDSVRRTLPDKDRYLEHIGKYADSSARSKVANAVRRGVAAHDIDDEVDDCK